MFAGAISACRPHHTVMGQRWGRLLGDSWGLALQKSTLAHTRWIFISGERKEKNDPAMWHLSRVWGAELRNIHALQPRRMLTRRESFLTPKTPMICIQECLKGLTRSVSPFNGAGEWQS